MTFYFTLLLTLMSAAAPIPRQVEKGPRLEQPSNISASTWVVVSAETGRGGEILSIAPLVGTKPLLDIAVANIRQWTFAQGEIPAPPRAPTTVVYLFRGRDLFAAAPVRPVYTLSGSTDHGPLPLELTDPGYPVDSVGEGLTILQLQVSSSGIVQSVRALSDAAGLAGYTEAAVRKWRFQPAIQSRVQAVGSVIVAVSYLRPVVNATPPQQPPAPGSSPVVAPRGTFTTNKPVAPQQPF